MLSMCLEHLLYAGCVPGPGASPLSASHALQDRMPARSNSAIAGRTRLTQGQAEASVLCGHFSSRGHLPWEVRSCFLLQMGCLEALLLLLGPRQCCPPATSGLPEALPRLGCIPRPDSGLGNSHQGKKVLTAWIYPVRAFLGLADALTF